MFKESRLHRMEFSIVRQAFDGGDLIALVHDCERHAGVDTSAVYMNGAGTALAMIATLLRAKELQMLAQRIE